MPAAAPASSSTRTRSLPLLYAVKGLRSRPGEPAVNSEAAERTIALTIRAFSSLPAVSKD
jgi:hypothetical protein